MAPPPPPRGDSPPALPDDMVEEILLHLPPGDPACLLRASLVCKAWGGAVSSPGFRRRLHERHRTPPVLGFLHNGDYDEVPRFIPTTASPFSLAAPDRRSWSVLDCRHGRALFWSKDTHDLLVWEPITGTQRHIPTSDSSYCWRWCPDGTVFCAADGCNHCDCHGGPFHLLFVAVTVAKEDTYYQREYVTSACLYSSETGLWGELTSMHRAFYPDFIHSSSVLDAGRSLLYFISDECRILECDLARHGLRVLDPPVVKDNYYGYHGERFCLMLAEDGGLGLSQAVDRRLKLWSRKASSDGTSTQWVLGRVIDLKNLLPDGAFVYAPGIQLSVYGFAEGANVIFLTTVVGIFTIELQSRRVRKVCDHYLISNLTPVVSFYTPLPFGTQQNSLTVPAECALPPN